MKQYTFVDYATQAYSALVAVLILLFHNRTVAHWPWLLAAHATGLALVHWLIQRNARGHSGKALDFLRHFYPVLLYTGFFCETGALNRMFFGDYLDPVVIRWDQALFGCQPSTLFMQKLPYLPVSEIFYAAYFSYYVMIGGVGIALFVRNREQFFHYVSVVSFVFYVCYLIYIIVPVIGPMVFFSEQNGYVLPPEIQRLTSTTVYPETVQRGVFSPLMAWIYRTFEAPGAAIPSSHVAIALCTVFFSFRYLRRIRYLHLAVALLLCLATIYCRYHYVSDVLAGVVTAALLVPLGNWLYFKVGQPVNSR
jgi:membrane-associated phospholipid phosphatase